MNWDEAYGDNLPKLEERDFEIRSLKNSLQCLEYILKRRELEIKRLEERLMMFEEMLYIRDILPKDEKA